MDLFIKDHRSPAALSSFHLVITRQRAVNRPHLAALIPSGITLPKGHRPHRIVQWWAILKAGFRHQTNMNQRDGINGKLIFLSVSNV